MYHIHMQSEWDPEHREKGPSKRNNATASYGHLANRDETPAPSLGDFVMKLVVLKVGSPGHQHYSRNALDMQILGTHPRPTELDILGGGRTAGPSR